MLVRGVTLGLCLAWASAAFGQCPCGDSGQRLRPWTENNGCCSIGCCPDDYCRKCPICIKPLSYCGGADDYCRKCPICIKPLSYCGGPDDYCRKPMPCLLCPPKSPYLQCGPSQGCCSNGCKQP